MNQVNVPEVHECEGTLEFDYLCAVASVQKSAGRGTYEDSDNLWSEDEGEIGPYEVSRIEARFYYAGVGSKGRGPSLVYRTSDDVFEKPSGPEAPRRTMRIIKVPDNHQLGSNGLWDTVRDHVRGLFYCGTISLD